MTGLFHQMKIYDFELIQFEATYADLYICISDGVVNYCQFDWSGVWTGNAALYSGGGERERDMRGMPVWL